LDVTPAAQLTIERAHMLLPTVPSASALLQANIEAVKKLAASANSAVRERLGRARRRRAGSKVSGSMWRP
jgi:hypothetical protein